MGWRFRKSVKILPGVRLNFGKKGLTSATIGGKFARTNISKRGTYNTYSLPGTGISYKTEINKSQPVNTDRAVALHWYCKQCYTQNLPDSQFCKNCGSDYSPNPQQQTLSKYDNGRLLTGLGIGLGILFVLSIIFTGVKSSNRNSVSPAQTNNSQAVKESSAVDSFTPAVSTRNNSTPAKIAEVSKTVKSKSNKSAVVISENANLRESADINGEVTQTLPEGTEVEISKQKGGWFLVKSKGQSGWLHGNTIRLNDSSSQAQEVATTNTQTTSRSPSLELLYDEPNAPSSSSNGYYLGPRGGCYTYTSGGNKRYVDRSLCH